MVDVGVLRHIDGFETGGTNLAQAIQGAPSILGSIASPVGRSGAFALRCNPAGTQEQYRTWGGWGSGGTASNNPSADGHYLNGVAVRFSDLAPGTEYAFVTIVNASDLVAATFILEADGDMRLDNQPGSGILTEGTPFTADTFHYLEHAVQLTATGAWEVWLDGVSLGSGTSDFNDTSSVFDGIQLGGAGSGDGNVDFDDIYAVSHTATLQGNNLGPSEVFAYQSFGNGVNANADSGLTTNDSAMDVGSRGSAQFWTDAQITPLNTDFGGWNASADGARISDETAGGTSTHDAGPTSGLYTVDGIIQGAMWLQVLQRGTGGGSTHVQWYGEGSQSPISSYTMDSISNNSNTFRAVVSDDAGPVPTSSQSFAMGAGTTGAQDIEIYGQWAFILHTPVVASDVFPLLPYKKPENVLLRR